jgi:SAM-dependent methyltransferase
MNMKLADIINRQSPPVPWQEGENIPWNDPGFSERMLREHLSQDHNAASRRLEIIDKHVDWIHREVLSERPSRILDLGCGPGLYMLRLAKLGHQCVGIDYSPASIAYAIEQAENEKASITCSCEDIRQADFGTGYDLVMLIFGELNVFPPVDAKTILDKTHKALKQGGTLLLEPHTFAAVEWIGKQPGTWHSVERGLFSDTPYLCLQENFWESNSRRAITRYYVIDTETGNVTRHSASYQAYTDDEYESVLSACGFSSIRRYDSLEGNAEGHQSDLMAIVAKK